MDKELKFARVPRHIGIIPDGNRRWAVGNRMEKQDGYAHGVEPGVHLFAIMEKVGVQEATFYGFTKDNTARPAAQTKAYVDACVRAVQAIAQRDAEILVVGKTNSSVFPQELLPYTEERIVCGNGGMKVNFLCNYDWNWDLAQAAKTIGDDKDIHPHLASRGISRMEMVIRWGGHTRLSGFLPVQSVYSDFYVVKEYWPDYKDEHFLAAMEWYQHCDVTLGG